MRYLLDTHALLWYLEDSEKLSETAAAVIEDADAQKSVSVASLWEFSIKYSIGKLRFEGGLDALWIMATKDHFTILPVLQPHLSELIDLPFLHRDPFDRLLIAAAIAEDLIILTADESIHQYDILWTW
jgi:PIN domain nuclease of toxin-antitoxin system